MREEGSKFLLFLIPTVLFMGLIYVEYTNRLVAIWQMATPNQRSLSSNILDRQRSKDGKLLTNLELALMKEVDKYSNKDLDTDSLKVASGAENVQKITQLRKWHGVPTPTILRWSTQGIERNDYLLGTQCGGCRVTTDRSYWNDSVAVVFFHKKHGADLPRPDIRHPDQVYVFQSVETPSKLSKGNLKNEPVFDAMFNLTMNFRRDSDIISYSGNKELALRHSKSMEKGGELQKILSGKNKLAVWFVSNCLRIPGAIARMRYVVAMVRAGLKLDKFGSCFRTKEHETGSVAGQSHDYKFYLAFENSIHCPSYISEKFWRNALDGVMVPIVFGPTKEDVEAIAPKKSYIHVDDFNSPQEVVDYLNYLDSNHTAYLEYHEWRYGAIDKSLEEVEYQKYTMPTYCRLCRRQVLQNHPPKTIPSVYKWFFKTGYVDDKCLEPRYKVDENEEKEMDKFFQSPNAFTQ